MQSHQKKAKYCLKLQETVAQPDDVANKVFCICGKSYTTKSNLNRHQQSCIEVHCQRREDAERPEEKISCQCGKRFTRSDNLKVHQRVCANTKDPDVVGALTGVIDRLIQNPRTTNNTTNTTVNTINLQPLTQNYMQTEGNRLLTEQIVMEGRQPEIAGKILSSRVRVADKSRKKIEYQDEEGNLSNDSRKLTQGFFKAIQEKNKQLTDEAYREIHMMVDEFIAADNAGAQEFTKLLMTGTDLQNMLIAINNVVDGVENEQSEDLIKKTIKKIIN